MKPMKRVLMMAGGTGGHVFPGLAVAQYFRNQGIEVHWLGTSRGLEASVVPAAHFPFHVITVSGIRGKGIKSILTAPINVTRALFQSRRIMDAINPDVVIGMGGFASGPGGLASWLTGRPLVIHEQNAIAGSTNRLLSKMARRVLTGFPKVFGNLSKVMAIGNPIRAEIEAFPPPLERFQSRETPCKLLVLGGSLGAKVLNDLVPKVLFNLAPHERPEVIHQTGKPHADETKKYYESMGLKADVRPFIEDMGAVYSWADMVLCRAGALTVSELCAVGLGAVFIPFPYAIDDHQTANAKYMVDHQAAISLSQSELTEAQLTDIVRELFQSPKKRLAMAEAAYALRKVNVAEKIYHICQEICH